jgi:hypothetical protein
MGLLNLFMILCFVGCIENIIVDRRLYRDDFEESQMEESAGEFEGDIILLSGNGINSRNGNTANQRKWPKNSKRKVIVPYVINQSYSKYIFLNLNFKVLISEIFLYI